MSDYQFPSNAVPPVLVAGANITITPSENTETIAASGGGGGSPAPLFYIGGPYNPAQSNLSLGGIVSTTDVILAFPFVLPVEVTTSQLSFGIFNPDTHGNSYDFGIIDVNGNLMLHTGTVTPIGSSLTQAWLEGSTTLDSGQYYFCIACSASNSNLQLFGFLISFPGSYPISSTPSSAGPTLPSTVVPNVPSPPFGYNGTVMPIAVLC